MLRKALRHHQERTLWEAVERKTNKWLERLGRKRPPVGNAYYGSKAGRYVQERAVTPLYHAEYRAVEKLLADVPDGASVLDVPFGTGRFVPLYLAKGMDVSGLDISEDMIAAAREALGEQMAACKVEIGDATRLPYADASFHLLVCIRFLGAIIPFAQAKQALREFGRVSAAQAILSINERKQGTYRWRAPRDSETMGGRLYAAEIEELLRQSGFRVARKEGPLSESRQRAVYMYLCERLR